MRVGPHAAPPSLWLHSALHPPLAHPRAGLRGIQPILVQLDDVGVVHQRQLLKHGLDLLLGKEDGRGGAIMTWSKGGMDRPHLMGRKGLPIPEVEFVPHHFYPLLRVHGQKGALDPRHVPLVHLGGKDVCLGTNRARVWTWSLSQPSPNHECAASSAQLSVRAGGAEAGDLPPRRIGVVSRGGPGCEAGFRG